MPTARTLLLTALAMLAFAGNSLLCRVALRDTGIDPASFTSIRIVSGALVLGLIMALRGAPAQRGGDWPSAFALFAYAAGFSYAYVSLGAATGALLLFGAVQATMLACALWRGERLQRWQIVGLLLALSGLVGLLLPGLAAPPLVGSMLMLAAGVAWGVYSLRGRGAGDATLVTAGNFLRAVAFSAVLTLITIMQASIDAAGVLYAVASGALASGLGYAVWYTALRGLPSTSAAAVQLSVPALAAAGGVWLLAEPMSLRLLFASAAILGGIALVISRNEPAGRA